MPRKKKNAEAAILHTEREILHVEEELLRETRETRRVAEETQCEVEQLKRQLHPHHITHSIAVRETGANMPNNVLTMTVGQSSTGTITPLATDGVTPSGGTVSAASFSIPPDPSFSAVDNGDGTAKITGLAVSAAPVTGTASCTVTDSDGAVSTFSTSFTITITAGTVTPPTATTASIAVAFSTPA